MATKMQRYQISVSDRTLKEIVDYQEKNNIGTRSGAMVELIQLGIQAIKIEEAERARQEKEQKK